MKVIAAGRAEGKTWRMLRWLVDHPDAIVVAMNEREAERVFDLAKELLPEIERRQFVSAQSCRERTMGYGHGRKTFVDNADIILADYLGRWPDRITVTGRAE